MVNPAGRPNKRYEVIDKDGTFTDFWYRFMEQMWVRSGGSTDDLSDLIAAVEFVETAPPIESVQQEDNLVPISVQNIQEDDLAPISPTIDLSISEIDQLKNINNVTISNAQWVFLGDFDQGLTTTSNVNFGDVTTSGPLVVNDTTSSIAPTQGSGIFKGGVGIAENLFVGSRIDADRLTLSGSTISAIIASTSNDFVAQFSSTDAVAIITLGDSASTSLSNYWRVQGNRMLFYTGNVQAIDITSAQNIIIPNGNFTVNSGNEVFLNLPTVSTGTSGSLWSDSGTVKVVP